MGPEKTTIMVLQVDLQCSSCYKKVKNVLCKFPQIRDQVFDEKANTVTITVVCCSPEKIRDKLCCKGGRAIKNIDIKDFPKPKETEKSKVAEKPKVVVAKPKETEKPKAPEKPEEAEKPKVTFVELEKPKSNGKGDMPKPDDKPAKPAKADPPPPPPPKDPETALKPTTPIPEPGIVKMPDPVNGYPPPVYPPAFPVAMCCGQCYNGYGGGPCHHGFGRPVPPPPGPCYDGYGYGGNRVCYVTRCDFFSEENPSGCSIM